MNKRRIALLVVAGLVVAFFVLAFFWRGGCADHLPPTPVQYAAVRHADLPYAQEDNADGQRRRLDILQPAGLTARPVVVILHGGSWTMGSKEIRAVQDLGVWLAERGVVAVPMGYRLVPQVRATQQPGDVARGVAWVAAHIADYGGDPARIFLFGHSAGGHLASVVACDRRYLDALDVPSTVPAGVIAVSTPFDLRDTAAGENPIGQRTASRAFGPDPRVREALSPLALVRAGSPPFLIMHGSGDHLVPAEQAPAMAAALHHVGGSATALELAGRDHLTAFHKITKPGEVAAERLLAFVLEKR